MKRSDVLVIYIYKLSQALRKGNPSTISKTDIFALLDVDIESIQKLPTTSLSLQLGDRSSEARLLFALALAQQAMLTQSMEMAKKATQRLLSAVDDIPSLQSPALVEILRNMHALQAA